MVRIRYPFAGAALALVIIAAYVGLGPSVASPVNDKAAHAVVFFLLTLLVYWAIDLPRRVLLKIVLSGSLAVSVLSEVAQGLLPNDRVFDPIDIAFNIAGSLVALALCNWYNKRMLERKRQKKYGVLPTDDGEDVELGQSSYTGRDEQELGIVEEGEEDDDAWDSMDPVEQPEAAPEQDTKT